FIRDLSAEEIVAQVLFVSRLLKSDGLKLDNIVVMGMGEPFHNYDAVMKAMDIICDPHGMNFDERRITISTVGIVPRIEQFAAAKRQIKLAVSLHAPSNAVRDQIIPANKKYPLESLLEACRNYTEKTGQSVIFEYTLIQGLNDDYENAELLCKRLEGMRCHVNLIPLNDNKKYKGIGADQERIQSFKSVLDKNGIPCTVRLKRGIDINAGCGQLAADLRAWETAPFIRA
ncbi:MAG: radical SAM protein, partial [Spirochaetia bacterium]|nr:radical SAM protein [Spirochaetia bacterium]